MCQVSATIRKKSDIVMITLRVFPSSDSLYTVGGDM